MRSDTQQQTQMNTQGSDVGSSLTRDPKDTEVSFLVVLEHLGFVDRSDTELTLDGRDQRRSLEEGSGEGFETPSESLLAIGNGVVESDDTDVFLSCTLLGFDESGGSVDTDDQASSDLGIEGTGVTSLLTSKDSLHPGDDFVGRRVGGLVEVDHSGLDIRGKVSLERGTSGGDRGEVGGSNKEFVVVFQEEGPLRGVCGSVGRRGSRERIGDIDSYKYQGTSLCKRMMLELTELGSDIRALDGEITGLLHSSHLFLGDDRGHFSKSRLTVVVCTLVTTRLKLGSGE